MKKICILFLFITAVISAQNKEYKQSLTGIKKIIFESNTAIEVIASSSSGLVLSDIKHKNSNHNHSNTHEDKNSKRADKRKGLTPIYPGGKDNTNGFGFSITKEGTTLYVTDLKSFYKRSGIKVSIPKNINISIDAGNMGSINVKGLTGEVEADTNIGAIKMANVTGPITAHTSVGAINIDFDKVSQNSPITINSSVSEIDISLPATTKATLELKTGGTVYTNFDFPAPPKKGLKNVSGNKTITGDINSGGVKIKIRSSMGDIYLRKK